MRYPPELPERLIGPHGDCVADRAPPGWTLYVGAGSPAYFREPYRDVCVVVRHTTVYRVAVVARRPGVDLRTLEHAARAFMAPGRHGQIMFWEDCGGLEKVSLACRLDAEDDADAYPLTVQGIRSGLDRMGPDQGWPGVEFAPGVHRLAVANDR